MAGKIAKIKVEDAKGSINNDDSRSYLVAEETLTVLCIEVGRQE